MQPLSLLLPRPQRLDRGAGSFALASRVRVLLGPPAHAIHAEACRLAASLSHAGVWAELTAAEAGGAEIALHVDDRVSNRAEGYDLVVATGGITVTGASVVGLARGVTTLAQLVKLHAAGEELPRLPCLRISDWPDFAHRGVLLDISRDKVPTMETLLALVDMLADLKVNQLQLYTEHVFAYRGHEDVWRDASPLTGDEVLALDAHCRSRHVELVPNQNGFGHMHRWLVHERYRPLAERPEGVSHPFASQPTPYGLCPTDPRSLELVRDLYDQLLPHFSSSSFNANMDETLDLGTGRSRHEAEEKGHARLWLDFVTALHAEVARHGKTMHVWADALIEHPGLARELPADVVALEWGYAADHPFAERVQPLVEAWRPFYVCPGTGSWNSIGGRPGTGLPNILRAARDGVATAARGFLLTDWGDNGHLQPLPVSWPAFVAGAAVTWNASDAQDAARLDVPALLDAHVFDDEAAVMGRLMLDLGEVCGLLESKCKNSSPLFWILVEPPNQPLDQRPAIPPREHLERCLRHLDDVAMRIDDARMRRADAALVGDELRWATDLLRLACRLAMAGGRAGDERAIAAMKPGVRAELAREMSDLVGQHRDIWLARSREGGRVDSVARLERLLDSLRGSA